ncbi:MAG: hypothetical protein AAGJ69_07605 [Cyanobacteria bacterium J06559_1]
MGFLSSDTANSADANSANANPATTQSSEVTSPKYPPLETIDSLIGQPARQPMGAVLPPFENAAFMSQRHEVNPALALNLLGDIQHKITAWQEQLRQLARAIHAITTQGPMVDGWLESSLTSQHHLSDSSKDRSSRAEASLLRHGDADALKQYVDAIESHHHQNNQDDTSNRLETRPDGDNHRRNGAIAQYRLCCLSEDGSVRSQPCPPAQMASVSTAIARYQKFKQLMVQKDALERKLQLTVDELTGIRARLQQD